MKRNDRLDGRLAGRLRRTQQTVFTSRRIQSEFQLFHTRLMPYEHIDWSELIQYRLTMIKWRESFIGSRGDLKRSCGWEKNSAIDSLRSLWGQNLMEFERIHFFAKITEHWSDNPRCMCVWVSESPWVSELLWVSGLPWEILLFILNHAFYFSLPSNCVSELNFFLPKEKIPSNTTCIMNDIHKHWQYSRIDV